MRIAGLFIQNDYYYSQKIYDTNKHLGNVISENINIKYTYFILLSKPGITSLLWRKTSLNSGIPGIDSKYTVWAQK